mmetsp:Transcript_86139/g.248725  ORF Transcript_86139/g.248725 Transcript_86139/m.248725 type:complete len:242 (+) Transcript_86139:2098-2823(+)
MSQTLLEHDSGRFPQLNQVSAHAFSIANPTEPVSAFRSARHGAIVLKVAHDKGADPLAAFATASSSAENVDKLCAYVDMAALSWIFPPACSTTRVTKVSKLLAPMLRTSEKPAEVSGTLVGSAWHSSPAVSSCPPKAEASAFGKDFAENSVVTGSKHQPVKVFPSIVSVEMGRSPRPKTPKFISVPPLSYRTWNSKNEMPVNSFELVARLKAFTMSGPWSIPRCAAWNSPMKTGTVGNSSS